MTHKGMQLILCIAMATAVTANIQGNTQAARAQELLGQARAALGDEEKLRPLAQFRVASFALDSL